jgi:hypothetical protein
MRHADLKARMHIPGRRDPASNRWIDESWIEHVWDPGRDNDPKNKKVSVVPLSPLALDVIQSVPIVDVAEDRDLVFSFNGRGPIKGWSKLKDRLDALMLKALQEFDPNIVELKPWQHRDLRRTAKTLMGRAGVRPDISEHRLAHAIRGIEGVYDRYDYLVEKREAFDALATVVERLVGPRPAGPNVVALRRHRP